MDLGCREQLAHEPHLAEGGAIEMPDAAGPQRPQDARLGVAFHGIENIAWKAFDKPASCRRDRCRPQAQQRLARPSPSNNRIDRGENSTPKRAERSKTGLRHRTILQNQEATSRSVCLRHRARNDQSRWSATPGETAGGRQTIVRVLRIACRNISVSLKDTGPRVAGSAEKDALRRSSTPGESGVLGTCDCVGALRWEKGPPIQDFFQIFNVAPAGRCNPRPSSPPRVP